MHETIEQEVKESLPEPPAKTLSLKCPGCGVRMYFSPQRQKQRTKIKCPRCQVSVPLDAATSTLAELRTDDPRPYAIRRTTTQNRGAPLKLTPTILARATWAAIGIAVGLAAAAFAGIGR